MTAGASDSTTAAAIVEWIERHPTARQLLDASLILQQALAAVAGVALTVATLPFTDETPVLFLPIPIYFFGLLKRIPKTTALPLPQLLRKHPANQHLILFVHGWNGDNADSWLKFPELVIQDQRFASCDVLAVNYPTYIRRRNLSIPELVAWLYDRLNATLMAYQNIAVIAHSMGGLVARELVLQSKLADKTIRIKLIVAIATPHAGANGASIGRALGLSRRFTAAMSPGSDFLTALHAHWKQLVDPPQTHGIGSPQDGVVDLKSAHFSCQFAHYYPTWNHREIVKPETLDDDRYSIPASIIDAHLSHCGPPPNPSSRH